MKCRGQLHVVVNTLAGLLAGVCFHVHAQTAPSAGDLQREIEPPRPSPLPALEREPQRLTTPSQPQPGAQVVRVREWLLVGNATLETARLLRLLQPFTDVALSLPQIREAAAIIQQAYEEAGWLARVQIPEQDITDGRVTLEIIEARLGSVQLEEGSTSRVQPERLQALLRTQQAPGTTLNMAAVNRGVLLADDLSGVMVSGTLAPGATPGTTDVILKARAEEPWLFDVSVDNTNARAVGAYKITTNLTWNSPAGLGESFTALAAKSEGSQYVRLGASVPIGNYGWRTSVYATEMKYRIITPDADGRAQDINGQTNTAGIDLTYPLLRTRTANLIVLLGLDRRRFEGFANDALNSQYSVPGMQAGFTGNHFDSFGGEAANSYSVVWRGAEIGTIQPQENPNTQGRFDKVNWSFAREQSLIRDVSLSVQMRGQNTGNKELDSSENMSLGGPAGVRAYPVGEASGPQAYIGNLELRWRVGSQWLFTPFFDYGRVEKRVSGGPREYDLRGVGLSALWTGYRGTAVRATYARRLGTNPNPDARGNDSDGLREVDRLWLSISASF